jgi:hypothetical protein
MLHAWWMASEMPMPWTNRKCTPLFFMIHDLELF